jgi:hypothetical protein
MSLIDPHRRPSRDHGEDLRGGVRCALRRKVSRAVTSRPSPQRAASASIGTGPAYD